MQPPPEATNGCPVLQGWATLQRGDAASANKGGRWHKGLRRKDEEQVKEVAGIRRGGVFSGEGPPDTCLRPPWRPKLPTQGKIIQGFRVFQARQAGMHWAWLGKKLSVASRAAGRAGGAGGGEGCRPHTHGGRSPSESDRAQRPNPTPFPGPFPTCPRGRHTKLPETSHPSPARPLPLIYSGYA